KRLLHAGPSLSLGRLDRQGLLKRLEETGNKRETLKAAINLEELWDLLVQEGQPSTAAELAELWFGRTGADEVAATGRCLREDRFLFKQKDDQVIPNSPELVAQLQEQHERELARHREMEEIGAWLQAVWEGREPPASPSWRDRVVALLRRLAVFGAEAPDYAQGKAYLDKARLTATDAPFRLLVRLGVFSEDEDLDLYRLEVPLEFAPEVLVQARQLSGTAPADPYAARRRDLTGLEIITIDGERTRDFDDALSLEEVPEGWRLGIHISDVSAMVQPDCPLDREARERATSIYLPERRLPMLPEEISEDALSLLAHQERRALSFLVTLSPAAEVLDWLIVPSLIQVGRRLTYHEVDSLLSQDRTLMALARLTDKLKEARLARGGYELKLPEVWVVFSPQGELQVSVEDQETPSRQLVAEAMVLANSLAARFLAEHGIPAVYRSQPAPREPIQREEHKSLLELWQDRRRLSRVVMDLEPLPHWGLGLDCYTLATSPIRRYLDLLTHRQLLAAVSETPPPYRPQDLEQILPVMEPAMRRAGQLKTRRLRYWLLKYLAARVGQKKEALVLDSLPHRYRLIFPDILLELFMAAPAGQRLSPGDHILVRLDKVSPREDQIKVSLA
ncbi:MAG: ribonuclease catalytic domain-containing protein, partial [Desulfobaccales bacterium]